MAGAAAGGAASARSRPRSTRTCTRRRGSGARWSPRSACPSLGPVGIGEHNAHVFLGADLQPVRGARARSSASTPRRARSSRRPSSAPSARCRANWGVVTAVAPQARRLQGSRAKRCWAHLSAVRALPPSRNGNGNASSSAGRSAGAMEPPAGRTRRWGVRSKSLVRARLRRAPRESAGPAGRARPGERRESGAGRRADVVAARPRPRRGVPGETLRRQRAKRGTPAGHGPTCGARPPRARRCARCRQGPRSRSRPTSSRRPRRCCRAGRDYRKGLRHGADARAVRDRDDGGTGRGRGRSGRPAGARSCCSGGRAAAGRRRRCLSPGSRSAVRAPSTPASSPPTAAARSCSPILSSPTRDAQLLVRAPGGGGLRGGGAGLDAAHRGTTRRQRHAPGRARTVRREDRRSDAARPDRRRRRRATAVVRLDATGSHREEIDITGARRGAPCAEWLAAAGLKRAWLLATAGDGGVLLYSERARWAGRVGCR